uniref:Peptidase C48, SUMO/sentrin/Ubl1 n=1 Tax=Tanacetum cinerariifolium TaxID=118510 RepID=A0A6L2KHY5_TANCI|nr:peptidase C48, SUMO/sentrin/Ubl1 [Tanacetum cinerariifolium]
MIHLEHYFGKPVGQWDFGLYEESDEQVLMLRRMRFKIATKILLHEFNVHAENMFDLAFKFESENDEQTRISIIVNAIKNRDERDPAKTKTFVENQEDDILKNNHGSILENLMVYPYLNAATEQATTTATAAKQEEITAAATEEATTTAIVYEEATNAS